MKIQGEHSFEAPREVVWEALLDPRVLAATLPGCERLQRTGDNAFSGAINIKVGPVQGRFDGTVELSRLEPPAGYHLAIKGTGPPGFVDGRGAIRLAENGGGTRLAYEVDAQVGGRIAGVGQRLLDSSARVITRQALEALDRQLPAYAAARAWSGGGGETAGEGGGAAPEAPAAPTQGELAVQFARGLAAELVPAPYRPWVLAAAVVVLLAAVFLLARACGA
jgi:uncharacterized protein